LPFERGKIRPPREVRTRTRAQKALCSPRITSLMSLSASPRASAGSKTRNPVLCASALTRLFWAFGALLLLWTTVFWALY